MSHNRDHLTHNQVDKASQPLPFAPTHPRSSVLGTYQSTLSHIQTSKIPPEPITSQALNSISTSTTFPFVEGLATEHFQFESQASCSESGASGQPQKVLSSLQTAPNLDNTIINDSKQQKQPQPQSLTAMWPDRGGPSGQGSKSRRRKDSSSIDARAPTQERPFRSNFIEGSHRGNQQYPEFREPQLPQRHKVASGGGSSRDKASTDTRKGKDRVERACSKCGTKNHIRKKICVNCEQPKGPRKVRGKRPTARRDLPPSRPSSSQHRSELSSQSTSQIQPRLQRNMYASSDAHQGGQQRNMHVSSDTHHGAHIPREDYLQTLLDPNSNFPIPDVPSFPATTGEEHVLSEDTRGSRHAGFYGAQSYNGIYHSLHHP